MDDILEAQTRLLLALFARLHPQEAQGILRSLLPGSKGLERAYLELFSATLGQTRAPRLRLVEAGSKHAG